MSDLPPGVRLRRLAEIRDQRRIFADLVQVLDQERNTLIAECFRTGEAGAAALSRATGISRQAVRQIRDREARVADTPTLPIRIGKGIGRA